MGKYQFLIDWNQQRCLREADSRANFVSCALVRRCLRWVSICRSTGATLTSRTFVGLRRAAVVFSRSAVGEGYVGFLNESLKQQHSPLTCLLVSGDGKGRQAERTSAQAVRCMAAVSLHAVLAVLEVVVR